MTVRTVLAPNPGPYTGPGTNTYVVVDDGEAVIIDPGPTIPEHELAIVDALGDDRPVAVVVTHTHPDHAPLANPLATRLGVPALGHAPGPEFRPDLRLADGDVVRFGGRELVAVHTPGHTADHLCFLLGDRLFTGDHIMEGSTVVIDDAAAYLRSLERVRDLGVEILEPGHGRRMVDAGRVVDEYLAHRRLRERQLFDAVARGARSIGELVEEVYPDVPPSLRPAATHQVGVQLRKLADEGLVVLGDEPLGPDTSVRPR